MSGTGTEDFGDGKIEIDFSETVHIDGPIEVRLAREEVVGLRFVDFAFLF